MMIDRSISPIDLVGSLVYRTRESMRSDKWFLRNAVNYPYWESMLYGSEREFKIQYYAGTQEETSQNMRNLDKSSKDLKFPAIFNIAPYKKEKSGNTTYLYLNLCFVAPVNSEWLTEQRDRYVFKLLLRPMWDHFKSVLVNSEYFTLNYGDLNYTDYEVFTTGESFGQLLNHYNDWIDAIEVHNLQLPLRGCFPDDMIEKMNNERSLIIDFFTK